MLWPPPTTPTSNTHIQAAVQLFLFALGKIITHLSVMDECDHANRYTAANLAKISSANFYTFHHEKFPSESGTFHDVPDSDENWEHHAV